MVFPLWGVFPKMLPNFVRNGAFSVVGRRQLSQDSNLANDEGAGIYLPTPSEFHTVKMVGLVRFEERSPRHK